MERRWKRLVRFSEDFSRSKRLEQRWDGAIGAKMDVFMCLYRLKEHKSEENSDKLAKVLSTLTSLE